MLFAQSLGGAGAASTSGTSPVSSSVMATEMCSLESDGSGSLQLLVLWEGVNLQLRLAPAEGRLWIQDREVALNGDNVVLVDDVDGSSGPQVVRTLRIDPTFDANTRRVPTSSPVDPANPALRRMPPPVHEFIGRSPEAVEFLRCGTQPPGLPSYEQQVFDMWCRQVQQR